MFIYKEKNRKGSAMPASSATKNENSMVANTEPARGTISSKGQVTIPKAIREILGLGARDQVVFVPKGKGRVEIVSANKSVSDLFGKLAHRKKARPVSIEDMNKAVRAKAIEEYR